MKRPDLVWGAWLVATLVSFGVLERRALKSPEYGHTLSATTRRWLGVYPSRKWRMAGTYGLIGGLVWFGRHMLAEELVKEDAR